MPLQPGTRIGGYEIAAPLGAGGMGEVYRARDTRLGRDVAIKILSPRIAADRDAVLRFEREASALATLNHPNIAAIYDVTESSGQPALVLELVDGYTLADRLAAGPFSIDEAIGYARQIAEALDVAHEAGIVHRDLKPGNIKVTEDGRVKVLDFGLAKAIAAAAGDALEVEVANSPTITVHGTGQGVILGTAAYMSPEQARGKRIDKRTDIWAFGCVLFEMLSRRPVFAGETTSDVIAAIIERAPDLSLLPPATPAHVRRVITRCLEKDPKRRARDIADVSIDLNDAAIASPVASSAARRLRPIAFVATGLAAGFLLALVTRGTPPPASSPVVRSSLLLPEGVELSRSVLPVKMANDGSAIAYIGERDGENRLYVQRLDQTEPMVMPGTEGASQPFFSPDARWIGYFADNALQKIAADGKSAPLRLAHIEGSTMGASWGPSDTIVWAVRGGGLRVLSVAGGQQKPVAGVEFAQFPEWLPDGQSILFTTGRDGNDSRAFATIGIDGGSPNVVAQLTDSTLSGPPVLGTGGNLLQAQFVEPGFLVFGQSPGAVRALPVDPESFAATGPPIPLADSIERGAASGGMFFAASRNGRLVSAPTGERHQLVWVDRSGHETPVSSDRMAYRGPQISPDGKTIAIAANDESTRRSDIWLYDTARATRSRLTTSDHNLHPLWTRDGSAIVAAANGLVKLPLAGGRELISSREQRSGWPVGTAPYPASWDPAGTAILVQANQNDIWRITTAGEVQPVLARDVDDWAPAVSPDGKWLAHASRESGRAEVYVRRYSDLGQKVMVSTNGGTDPMWARNGREIFYRQGDAMMAVRIDLGAQLRVGQPTQLFSGRYTGTAGDTRFDVAADGRFVMVKSDPASELRRLAIVLNLFEAVR